MAPISFFLSQHVKPQTLDGRVAIVCESHAGIGAAVAVELASRYGEPRACVNHKNVSANSQLDAEGLLW